MYTAVWLTEALQAVLTELKQLGFPFEEGKENAHIFGSSWGLDARDLIYLIFQLEQRYDLHFHETDYDDERIYTPQGLALMVTEKICMRSSRC